MKDLQKYWKNKKEKESWRAIEMNGQMCESCRFWKRKVDGMGECHRDSPSPDMSGFVGLENEYGDGVPRMAVWPLTPKDEWCGEYECKNYEDTE